MSTPKVRFVIALTKIYVILSDLCYLGVWQL
nr:MAG TPA: SURF1 superfamily [Caudoviricetes sp.]